MSTVIIAGAGGHGRAIAEILSGSARYSVVGFLDDAVEPGQLVFGCPVLGRLTNASLAEYCSAASCAIVAIGNNRVRESVQKKFESAGFQLISAIHSSAHISPSATIGRGCAVMACTAIGTEAKLGDGVILNTGAIVDHHCHADSYSHLGTNSAMAGGSNLGGRAWMQAGAALGYGVLVEIDEVLLPGESRVVE